MVRAALWSWKACCPGVFSRGHQRQQRCGAAANCEADNEKQQTLCARTSEAPRYSPTSVSGRKQVLSPFEACSVLYFFFFWWRVDFNFLERSALTHSAFYVKYRDDAPLTEKSHEIHVIPGRPRGVRLLQIQPRKWKMPNPCCGWAT